MPFQPSLLFLTHAIANLLGRCKTNSIATKVIDGVIAAKESIAEDSKRTCWRWDIHCSECRDAGALDFQNVIKGRDGEVLASQGEGEIWK